MNIEQKVKEYCEIMNIKIIGGVIPKRYEREIQNYIHTLVKPKLKQKESLVRIKEPLTKIADLLKRKEV